MHKVIRTKSEYEEALSGIEKFIERSDKLTPEEEEKLELLLLLVQDYEVKNFPLGIPDPIEAIRFRMDQQNLSPRDLIPFIGSRSKVSEILARKRPLTLSMIRALNSGLGIPAKVLLQEQSPADFEDVDIKWERFPIREMVSRGWIKHKATDLFGRAEDALIDFLKSIGSSKAVIALYRSTKNLRSARTMDRYALFAWTVRVITRAMNNPCTENYVKGTVTLEFMTEIAKLSVFQEGPRLAQEFLKKYGIPLIIEQQLSKTFLDGAAIMLANKKASVIGLTLRHDRIDNFWFCLMHELAHISLHFNDEIMQFYDDLDVAPGGNPLESEADELANEALIPRKIWDEDPAKLARSPEAVEDLAKTLRIHPAIVAGRVRRECNDYRILSNYVGHRQVRKLFPEFGVEPGV